MNTHDIGFLKGTRIILALWIAIGHFYYHVGGINFLKFPLCDVILFPEPAVDGFIVITGFLITYHYILRQEKDLPSDRKTWLKFYLKRFLRLYPVYLVIILIGYFSFDFVNEQFINMHHYFYGKNLTSLTYGTDKDIGFSDLFTHLTFIHGLSPEHNTSIIGTAWSLSTGVQFYILFPFIFLLFGMPKRLFTLIIISTVAYIAAHKLYGVWGATGTVGTFGVPSLLIHKMVYFTFGIAMAKYKLGKCTVNPVLITLLAIALFTVTYVSTIVCFFLYALMFTDEHKAIFPNIVYKLLQNIKSFLSSDIMEFGSNVSYSLYLIHVPLIPISFSVINSYFGLNKIEIILFTLFLFLYLSIFLSWIFHVTIEKPFIKLGKKLFNEQPCEETII